MTGQGLGYSTDESFIATARLVMRRPQMRDAVAVAALANDRVIAENTALIPYPYKLADAEAWIAATESEGAGMPFLAFAADGAAGETLVGAGGLGRPALEGREAGYWVGAPFRGRGYATEIARALVDLAFEHLGEERLTAKCRVTNTASRRVLEKCGFQWAGCGLASSLGMRGAFPVDRFRFDRGAWASLRGWRGARVCAPEVEDRACA